MNPKFYTFSKHTTYRWGWLLDEEGRYIAEAVWESIWKIPTINTMNFYRPVEKGDINRLKAAEADEATLSKVSGHIARLERSIAAAPTPEAQEAIQEQELLLAAQYYMLVSMYKKAGRIERALDAGPVQHPVSYAKDIFCYEFGRHGNVALYVHGNAYNNRHGFAHKEITDKRRMI